MVDGSLCFVRSQGVFGDWSYRGVEIVVASGWSDEEEGGLRAGRVGNGDGD